MADALWGQSGNYDAVEDRKLLRAIWANEGVVWGMTLTVNGTTGVIIDRGQAVISDEGNGMFMADTASPVNVTISSSAGTYLVWVQVDNAATGGVNISYAAGSTVPNYAVQVGVATRSATGVITATNTRAQAVVNGFSPAQEAGPGYLSLNDPAGETLITPTTVTGTTTFNTPPLLTSGYRMGPTSLVTKRFSLHVIRSTDFTCADNTWTRVPYDLVPYVHNDYGTATSWQSAPWPASANGQVVLPVNGIYFVTASNEWARSIAVGERSVLIARVNSGSTVPARIIKLYGHNRVWHAGDTGTAARLGNHTCTLVHANAGDRIETWTRINVVGGSAGTVLGDFGTNGGTGYDHDGQACEMTIFLLWAT